MGLREHIFEGGKHTKTPKAPYMLKPNDSVKPEVSHLSQIQEETSMNL